MASTVTITQRVSLENGGRSLRVSTSQNGQTTSRTVELKEPVRNLRQLHTITDYAAVWPSTRLTLTDADVTPPDGSETA